MQRRVTPRGVTRRHVVPHFKYRYKIVFTYRYIPQANFATVREVAKELVSSRNCDELCQVILGRCE